MRRLRKADVEALLRDYDQDPIGALTAALRIVLDRPRDDWAALLVAAPLSDSRRGALLVGDQTALDELAAQLNEVRSVGG